MERFDVLAGEMQPGDQPPTAVEALGLGRPAWHRRAACRGGDTSLFFLDRGEDPEPAKTLCSGCPVEADCLATALEGRERGIWGGTSERARTRIRQTRRAA